MADGQSFGRFELRAAQREVLIDGKPVALGARAFDVLVALVERRDRRVTKDELFDLVWPPAFFSTFSHCVPLCDGRRRPRQKLPSSICCHICSASQQTLQSPQAA